MKASKFSEAQIGIVLKQAEEGATGADVRHNYHLCRPAPSGGHGVLGRLLSPYHHRPGSRSAHRPSGPARALAGIFVFALGGSSATVPCLLAIAPGA